MYRKDARRCQVPQIFKLRQAVLDIAAVALASVLLLSPAAAQKSETKAMTETTADGKKTVVSQTKVEVKEFGGLGWGIGIAANFDVRGRNSQQLSSAQLVNGIVRVTDTSGNATVSFVLEAHYFFKDYLLPFSSKDACTKDYKGSHINCTEMAHGPFVAIEVGGGVKSAVEFD